MEYAPFPRARGEPRRTGRANADVATGRGVLSLPHAKAFRSLTYRLLPVGVSHIPFANLVHPSLGCFNILIII